ncbi:MAG TPA: hypothetical protein VGR82_03395 [Methylomirabilota bacterium]|jgi:hypothetical protein|nr:hypothetical protein [Methylomirabilota bacterium]
MAADRARVLMAIFEGQEAGGVAGVTRVARLARAQNAALRVAYFHRIPPGREDRRGRIIVETDREMARIEHEIVAAVTDAAGAAVECVVRFGARVRELDMELDVYAPGTLAVLAPSGAAQRWRWWRVRRRLARRAAVRVVVLDLRDGDSARPGRRLATLDQRA